MEKLSSITIEETPAMKGGVSAVGSSQCCRGAQRPVFIRNAVMATVPYSHMQRVSHRGLAFSPRVYLYGIF